MDESYDALDRATMATWRVTNVVGWGSAALGAAILIHQVADEVLRRHWIPGIYNPINARPSSSFRGTWQFWAPLYGFRAAIGIAIALLIGTLIGRKVWKKPAAVAALAAVGYTAVSWLVLEFSMVPRDAVFQGQDVAIVLPEHGLPRDGMEWSYSALALIVVLIAPLWAGFTARRKAAAEVSPGTP